MNIGEIVNAQPTLQKLTQIELPIATAIAVLKICKDTADHVKVFQDKQRAMFEKHGVQDEEKDQLVIPEEGVEKFQKLMEKILKTDVELDFKPIAIEAFGDVKLTVGEVNQISWLLA